MLSSSVLDVIRQRDDVAELGRRGLGHEDCSHFGPRVVGLEQLLGESENATAERVHRVVGQVDRETAVQQRAEGRIEVPKHGCGHDGSGNYDARSPLVVHQDGPGGERPVPDGSLPVVGAGREVDTVDAFLDLGDEDVDHSVEDVLLVVHVVVERHRLYAERFGEVAHAERLEPLAVGEVDGGAQDALPAQREAGLRR